MDNNLRLILLVIGVCIVLGFYIWEILRKKKNENKTDILKAVDEIPESPIHSNQVFTEEDYTKAITDLSELSNNLKDAQFSLDSNYSNASKNQVDNDLVSDNLLTKKDKIPSENLIIFYITSREGEVINGHSFYKVMNEVGMEYDEMKIFHYFKDQENNDYKIKESSKPVFSIANMYEPGYFDVEKISDMKTKGIVAFMYKEDYVDNYAIFENIFFPKLQKISKYLNTDIRLKDFKLCDDSILVSIKNELRLDAMQNFLKE